MLERRDGNAVQPAPRPGAPPGDPLVVEAGEAGGEVGVLEARGAQAEARVEHHDVDAVAVGVGENAFDGIGVDALDRAEPVLGWAARPRSLGLRIAPALDHERGPAVGREGDVLGPARHRRPAEGGALGDVCVGVDDGESHRVSQAPSAASGERRMLRGGEPLSVLAAPPVERGPGPADRVLWVDPLPRVLAIAVPQLASGHRSHDRAADHLRHDPRPRVVQPGDGGGPRQHEVAHRGVVAVDHPRVAGDHLGDATAELVLRQRRPSRLPVDGIQLDEGDAQAGRERAPERRLA